jgi:uncharacterized protein (TIGR02118 family)
MYTVVFAVYRREDLTQDEFSSYWRDVHGPIGVNIPGLRGYRICPVTESEAEEGPPIAGFAMMDFDSEEAWDAALTSPEFATTAQDAGNFARHFSRYTVDIHTAV